MQLTSPDFPRNAAHALHDAALQRALGNLKAGFPGKRAAAVARLPEFEALRDLGRDLKNHIIEHLDYYLEQFEASVQRQGGQVHWARDAEEARAIILGICQRAGAKTVTKGKSMVSEEIGLNEHLAAHGIEPIETDLGEYIIQLRGEHPSHIIAPAIHVNLDQVSDAFHQHHQQYGKHERQTEPRALMNEAREILRDKFLRADVGITGANFCIAETGQTVIVTNEGNGDLTQLLPRVHIAITSIEKVVPTLEDAATFIRLLARSATGQEISVYTTFSAGGRRAEDLDGPEEFHVVLLDNGRSQMVGGEQQDMLRCIRCSACMNHCPVYGAIGGHAYGWVYPGPMGSVLTPQLVGIEHAAHLPNASTFCGRCESVCPVRIPLPRLLRNWRAREFERHLTPQGYRFGLRAWAWLTRRPALYCGLTRLGARLLRWLGGRSRRIRSLPLAGGWSAWRDMPAPQGRTFQALWAERQRAAGMEGKR
ncbi:LutB/LldF family L-lactate oxidation iron-sulfur protein [Plasticicumulans acidivorans]|uniref:L-lactate dehydrogenase complex protein LldF n=1 Tax=Plasticicumulans acidivorans TaxID=886464 RepID=A0A317MVR8_9GAMM|nr:LutB/LldF family L-lactate oxidation iron-sulfur protein [Plasticicumulans acidivorans]PWV62462.1 L-lactate dehydrogenase complex protein LldF [Plasticicumulans acidivorans]